MSAKLFRSNLVKLLVLVVSTSSESFGTLRGTFSLQSLLDQADVVVAAKISQVEYPLKPIVIDLAVLRTIKGADVSGQTMRVSWAGGGESLDGRSSQVQPDRLLGRTGLFFLKQSGADTTLLPLASGAISEEDFYLPAVEALSSGSQYASGIASGERLQNEIQAASQDQSNAGRLFKMFDRGELDTLGRDVLSPLLQAKSVEIVGKPEGSYLGLAGQIRNSMPTALVAFSRSPLTTASSSDQMIIASAVCDYRGLDSTGILALASLTSNGFPLNLRTCATHSLREIHTASTLPTLNALLEDSSSWRIRYDAVIGIAEFAMKFPVSKWSEKHLIMSTFQPGKDVTKEMKTYFPAMDVFVKNEQQYIKYWKSWLIANNAAAVTQQK